MLPYVIHDSIFLLKPSWALNSPASLINTDLYSFHEFQSSKFSLNMVYGKYNWITDSEYIFIDIPCYWKPVHNVIDDN